MKLIWVYLAVVFGGALIAVVYLRAEERGWISTALFFGAIAAVAVVQSYRQRRSRER